MVEIIVQCDKCGKAKIKKAGPRHIHDVGSLSRIAGFEVPSALQYASQKNVWAHLNEEDKMLCPECLEKYRLYVKSVEGKATEKRQEFFG